MRSLFFLVILFSIGCASAPQRNPASVYTEISTNQATGEYVSSATPNEDRKLENNWNHTITVFNPHLTAKDGKNIFFTYGNGWTTGSEGLSMDSVCRIFNYGKSIVNTAYLSPAHDCRGWDGNLPQVWFDSSGNPQYYIEGQSSNSGSCIIKTVTCELKPAK